MNLSGLLDLITQQPAWQRLAASAPADRPKLDGVPHALHLPTMARAPILAQLYAQRSENNTPILFVLGRVDSVPIWMQTLAAWLPPGTELLRFPEPTPLPFDRAPWSDTSRMGRLAVLTRLMAGQHPSLPAEANAPIIVTSVRALQQKTLPKRRFLTALRVLKIGQIVDLPKLLVMWAGIGYTQVQVVEAHGQYSQRGGIIDIFPAAADFPVRIELFGDEIDTMRRFDPATQRSIRGAQGTPEKLVVPPVREALPKDMVAVGERLMALATPSEEVLDDGWDEDLPSWRDDLPYLTAGVPFPNLEFYLPLGYPRATTLLDYLPKSSMIFADDWRSLADAARDLAGHAARSAGDQHELPPAYPHPLVGWDTLAMNLAERDILVLGDIKEDEDVAAEPDPTLRDIFQSGPRFGGQTRPFLALLNRVRDLDHPIVVVSRQAQRLSQLWRQEKTNRRDTSTFADTNVLGGAPREKLLKSPQPKTVTFVQGSLSEGFELLDESRIDPISGPEIVISVLTDAEIFGWTRPTPRRRSLKQKIAPEMAFADIKPGDFVVHVEYGVGRFLGLVVRNIGGSAREYLQVQFSGNDTIYVPAYHADRLGKWIGGGVSHPTLDRLSNKGWQKARQNAQKAVNELADELLDLYAAREKIDGHAFAADGEWQADLEAAFPYQETEDQISAIEAVKVDMEKAYPMDRLICGDVGFGKTEVALRAAFKAVVDGKQVAVLVPTTVLAQQHYETFRERIAAYPVTVGVLSRFRKPSQIERTLRELREGLVDIVIGTHRLLSKDVSFKDLGLVIIDEEQRFGVSHKESLKKMRTEVDVLTLTATPIPRTLHMGLAGLRDISIIETPPAERLPVQTYVGASDDTLIRRALLRELDRGGQVFVVHNHVQTIGSVKQKLQKLVPDATILIGHGQMGERQLESVMAAFTLGEADILLSTTIIESGLDIPNANTLIVDHAEWFGLTQLYQLRGRVGRGVNRAYAYFFHGSWRGITPEARARLETIEENTHLGAGYQVAMRDLEIRGAGELLGANQSGHIGAVGFDLYTRMLARAVRARKANRAGEQMDMELPPTMSIDLPLAGYLPIDYLPDPALRLRLYRRMALLEGMVEIEEMAAELADRFGPIPDPLDHLLYQLRIKVLALKARVTTVATENGQVRIRMGDKNLNRMRLQAMLGNDVRVSKQAIWLGRGLSTNAWKVRLVQLLEKLAHLDRAKFVIIPATETS